MLSSAHIRQSSALSAFADPVIREMLKNVRMHMAGDFTAECERLFLFVQCTSTLHPCLNRVWCSDVNALDLQAMVKSKCVCSSGSPLCMPEVLTLSTQAGLTEVYRIGQAPGNSTCQVINSGKFVSEGKTYPVINSLSYAHVHTHTTHTHTHTQ